MNSFKNCTFILLCFFLIVIDFKTDARYDPDLDIDNLFANETYIVSLTDESLISNLLHQDRVFLLFLYSNLCPNCAKIVLEIKEYSRRVSSWNSLFRIASINCITFPIVCSNLKITAYPSFIILPSNQDELPKNLLQQFKTIAQIHAQVIDIIQSQSDLMNSHNLVPTLFNTKTEICNLFRFQNAVVFSFIILESISIQQKDSLELILDSLEYRKSIQIRRFYSSNLSFLQEFHIQNRNLPAFFALDLDKGNCNFSLISKYNSDNTEDFRQKAILYISKNFALDLPTNITYQNIKKSDDNLLHPPPISELTYSDLYNTLKLLLVKDMHRFVVFGQEEQDILKEFYLVMQAHFPFRNENVRRFFKRMNIWWSKRPPNKDVPIINYEQVTRISDGFLMPITVWKHCKGSKSYYRGYSCGLWSLFHVLTVQEYFNFKNPQPQKFVQNSKHKNSTEKVKPIMKHDSLRSMIRFIPKFFSCNVCSSNFYQSTIDFESQLTSPESSILYLWRLHNLVNARLVGDESIDPYFPKNQFPSKSLCSECSDNNGLFNETEVLKFLLKYYKKQTLRFNSDN